MMIIEKILGGKPENPQGKPVETVSFEWFEMNNRILKKVSSKGREIGLRLSEPLLDGGLLFEDDEGIILLELLPCEICRVHVHSPRELGRVCFELGNRHLPVSIREDDMTVNTPYDKPTFEYLERLGFHCERAAEKFTPEIIVRGHSH